MADTPRGIGIYLQALKPMKETPAKAAKLCKDNGVGHVAIWAVNQTRSGLANAGNEPGRVDTIDTWKRYSDAFRNVDVDIWIWGFPYCGREVEFVEAMQEANEAITPNGWIIDPEVSYKWKTPVDKDKKTAAAKVLATETIDAIKEGIGLVMTSYGMIDFHKNFPWKELAVGVGQPQLYLPDIVKSKDAASLVNQGIASWVKLYGDDAEIVPAVPAFGENSGAKMHDFLSYFVDENEPVSGMTVWSWPSISPDEWRIIKRWSNHGSFGEGFM